MTASSSSASSRTSPGWASLVEHLSRPLTATQLARRSGMTRQSCSRILAELTERGAVVCLNPSARRNRVFGLVNRTHGRARHRDVDPVLGGTLDWDLVGWVSFAHRRAIVKALTGPMQPAEIKRRARTRDPTLRMSAGNARDIIKLFLQRGIVRKLRLRNRAHPRYELTPMGLRLRQELLEAEAGP